jgi:gamma-glutamylcyclotransferase (GGCT)/AIG2-like uncharacterized protein YtfP
MGARKFYFAYGANTHREHMASRCPAAKPVGKVKLFGHALAFRGVADVIRATPDVCVHGALWSITDECERALDRFEGFPNLYIKRVSMLRLRGETVRVMFYVMRKNDDEFSPPPRSYENTLREGYAGFGLSLRQIDEAIAHATASDSPPPFISKWHKLDGDAERPTGKRPAKLRAREGVPPAREPVPNAWDEWRFASFDERLRRARAAPLPLPSQVEAARRHFERIGNHARLLAVPVGTTPDLFPSRDDPRRKGGR